jgi:DNA-binding NtrC family response regulator
MANAHALLVMTPIMARLLIIDDEPALLELLSRICRSAGIEVCGCTTLTEGLKALRTWQPNLVLIDYRLGPDSGLTLLEVCQREYPTLPTIMISAERSPELVIQALRLGVRDFLLKPVASNDLLASLQHCLNSPKPASPAPAPEHPQPAAVSSAEALPVGIPLSDFIRDQEYRFIQACLEHNKGSREKTAAMLDISLATLYRKISPSRGRST